MFFRYFWLVPYRRIFQSKKISSWISLSSTGGKDSFVARSWEPALLLFCQDWGTFSAGRIFTRTYIVILRYKIGQIPSPVTTTNRGFTLIYAALFLARLLTISRIRDGLQWDPWRHWFYVFLTNNLAWSFFNILGLFHTHLALRWLDVVISHNETQRFPGWASHAICPILTVFSQWKLVHFYFQILRNCKIISLFNQN